MLIRDANGKIVIIFRKDCKNELFYNAKIYNIIEQYKEKYTDIPFNICPKLDCKDKHNNSHNNANNITNITNNNKFQKYNNESNDESSDEYSE